MKRTSELSRLLAAVSLTCMLGSPLAGAQEREQPIRPGKVVVSVQDPSTASAVQRLPRREPLPFQPLDMVDPVTQQPVTPSTVLTVAPGVQSSAGDHYARLNRLEAELNARGYSLRDPETLRSALKRSGRAPNVDRQFAALTAAHRPFDPATMAAPQSIDELVAEAQEKALDDDRRLQAIGAAVAGAAQPGRGPAPQRCDDCEPEPEPTPPPTPRPTPPPPSSTHTFRSWNHQIGDPATLAAHLTGQLDMRATRDETRLVAEALGGVTIQHNAINLVRGATSIVAPRAGSLSGTVDFSVAGQAIWHLDETGAGALTVSGSLPIFQLAYSQNYTFPFLGFIPVTLTAGVTGSARVDYFFDLRFLSATADITPYLSTSGFVQAGIGVPLLGVGVGGAIQPIGGYTQVHGKVEIQPSGAGLAVVENYFARNHYDLLNGRIYLYGCALVCGQTDIWSWPGFTVDGYMFNVSRTTPLAL